MTTLPIVKPPTVVNPALNSWNLRAWEMLRQLSAQIEAAANKVSVDRGNADATLVANVDEQTQVWNTPLTANRAVTLSTVAPNGAKFHIVRTAAATGAFNLNVGTGPLKALAAGQWCDVEYNGSAWVLTAFGSL